MTIVGGGSARCQKSFLGRWKGSLTASTTRDVLCSDILRKHIFYTSASAASRLGWWKFSQELLLRANTSVPERWWIKLFRSNFLNIFGVGVFERLCFGALEMSSSIDCVHLTGTVDCAYSIEATGTFGRFLIEPLDRPADPANSGARQVVVLEKGAMKININKQSSCLFMLSCLLRLLNRFVRRMRIVVDWTRILAGNFVSSYMRTPFTGFCFATSLSLVLSFFSRWKFFAVYWQLPERRDPRAQVSQWIGRSTFASESRADLLDQTQIFDFVINFKSNTLLAVSKGD